ASSLGISCAYIGQAGDDEAGTVFLSSLVERGVHMLREPLPKSPENPKTGRCFMIQAPDGQIAKAIYLGASSRLFWVDINTAAMLDARFLLAEGYLFEYQSNQKYLTELLKFAKGCRLTVACTLPDKAVIERYRRVILKALEFIDILIGNESEIQCLFPANGIIRSFTEGLAFSPRTLFIATLGHKGAAAAIRQDIVMVKPEKISAVVDKDGAGDAFAAGFLYGRIKGLTLKQSLKIGNICANEIICHEGHLPKTPLLPLIQSV
ncbi:MAG: PfkB family carbohydrate kinase, partial [Alphaproteobacteria bacterium]|nr:PfkB family carbohydrate kinase [Alphaproteobacteria bacterium]